MSPPTRSTAALVREFHEQFGLPIADAPIGRIPADLAASRLALLAEETDEYAKASRAGDLASMADALADIVYVCYGTALAYGLDLDAVLIAVHDSNMAKLGPAGPVVDPVGKVVKPQGWQPPDVAAAAGLRARRPLGG